MNIESLLSGENLSQMAAFVVAYGLKIIVAVAIFIVGKWVAKKLTGFVGARMKTSSVDITVSQFCLLSTSDAADE